MLKALRQFFDQQIAGDSRQSAEQAESRARVAAAALLVEVVRDDERLQADEREAVLGSVQRKFGLTPAQAEDPCSVWRRPRRAMPTTTASSPRKSMQPSGRTRSCG